MTSAAAVHQALLAAIDVCCGVLDEMRWHKPFKEWVSVAMMRLLRFLFHYHLHFASPMTWFRQVALNCCHE
jgi:hypothetical protein